jgi:hypothetical protein
MSRYERVVFMQGDEADEALRMLDVNGEDEAIEFLAQMHNPGEHETADELSHGSADDFFESDDGYILSWNEGLEYIGLEFDTEFDLDELDENPCTPEHHREYNSRN